MSYIDESSISLVYMWKSTTNQYCIIINALVNLLFQISAFVCFEIHTFRHLNKI